MSDDIVSRNRALQQAWYGEPIGDTVRRLTGALRVTQAQLADVVGLSAPMLSQLASGQRAKIANPAVLSRVQQVAEIASDPTLGTLPPSEVERRLQAIRISIATSTFTGAVPAPDLSVIRTELQARASPAEIEQAARLLDGSHPALAKFLRAYGCH
ncbi:MAG: XRE family transcriptional regulator [Pseudonocardiales bacterium]|nr:MAG: XRE family transcriptional regulator [Pseudonocardiales bacterium]